MSRKHVALVALALSAGTLAFATVRAQDEMPPMPKPGPEHAKLLEGVGEWEGKLTSYMMGGEAVMEATEKVTALGGFWALSRFECDFMGAPYVGTGCVGYDSKKGKYVGTWIDNMSDYLAVMEGQEEGDALVMRWEAPSMAGDGALAPHRSETVTDGDSYTSTFYVGEGDGAQKVMVIEMHRKM